MCADQFAFAAIGTGARHAESQFMLSNYSWSMPNGEALLLAYTAKRSAEVAPGVGEQTDVLVIGPQVGQTNPLPKELVEKLEIEYQKVASAEKTARKAARDEVSSFIEQLAGKNENIGQAPASAGTAISVLGSEPPRAKQ
jgi:cellobiose-specific phosphotransferase system component IIB